MATSGGSTNIQAKSSSPRRSVVDSLQPTQTSFYIKVGAAYSGVYFTVDPALVQFADSDCLNRLVTGRNVDLKTLEEVFKKCPNIENLKFFGINIKKELVALIAENCPQLKNLELNLYEQFGTDEFELDFVNEMKLLLQNCKEIENLIIRKPSNEIQKLIRSYRFGYDKVDRNYFFGGGEKSKYDLDHHWHHNVNMDGFRKL